MRSSLSCQRKCSFHNMNHSKHICHYTICLFVARRFGIIANGGKRLLPLGMLQQKEEEHLSALMLMSERMEKRAIDGNKKLGAWAVGRHWMSNSLTSAFPSHSVSSAHSQLTGCRASFPISLQWEWSDKLWGHNVELRDKSEFEFSAESD